MASPSLTQSQLKELLHYDPDTGIFTNLVTRNGRALIGDQAGYLRPTGYVIITLNYKRYRAHRLAWLYMYGVWPKDQLDHINRVSHNNRIANLREVSNSENQQNSGIQTNNTSGHKGVSWIKGRRKWHAKIRLNNNFIHLGIFINLDDAVAARKQAEEQLHTHRSVA
jgi:hypothetical protein